MSETKFTTGPWFVSKKRNRICAGDGVIVAQTWNPPCRLTKEAKEKAKEKSDATARLIAAAPDLYAAAELSLHVAESWIHDQLDGTSMIDEALAELEPARAALRKARGEQS